MQGGARGRGEGRGRAISVEPLLTVPPDSSVMKVDVLLATDP